MVRVADGIRRKMVERGFCACVKLSVVHCFSRCGCGSRAFVRFFLVFL